MCLSASVERARKEFELLKPLIDEFGESNVEEAIIFIMRAYNSRGLKVCIKSTPEMVRACLEAVHGRRGVNEVRIHA